MFSRSGAVRMQSTTNGALGEARRVGRIIGVLILLHLVTGLVTPYVMLQPVSGARALEVGAGMETTIRAAVAMLFVGGVVPVAIAITTATRALSHRRALGLWLVAIAAVSLAMQVVESQHFLTLLSMSVEHARATPENAAVIAAMSPVVRATWKWAHYTHLLSVVGWMLLFASVLFHTRLVPRALSAAVIVTTLMQLAGITFRVLIGYSVPFPMEVWGMPLGVAYLGLAAWLMVRGFPASDADAITRSEHAPPPRRA